MHSDSEKINDLMVLKDLSLGFLTICLVIKISHEIYHFLKCNGYIFYLRVGGTVNVCTFNSGPGKIKIQSHVMIKYCFLMIFIYYLHTKSGLYYHYIISNSI